MAEGTVEDRLLDRGADPGWGAACGTGNPIEQPLGAKGLEVPANLVALLAAVARHPASFAHLAELGGGLQQAALASCYVPLRGHVDLRIGG
jgi:hypothetical protein